MDGEKKKKRNCTVPYRKWTDYEQRKLIQFLRKNHPIEQPTAQEYYRRYLNENGMDCQWTLVRSKVKNMRGIYKKLKSMQNSTGTSPAIDQDFILKKCPMFYEYEEVFGNSDNTWETVMVDTEDSSTFEIFHKKEESMLEAEYSDTVQSAEIKTVSEDYRHESQQSLPEYNEKQEEGQKEICLRIGLSDVLQVQSGMLSMRKENKEREYQLKEAELKLQREKFLFEKEKFAEENKRKDRELAMERKLRIMEMRYKREVALKEIEMKERVEMEKLKNKM